MNLRALAFTAAVVGFTVFVAGCQRSRDIDALDELMASSSELTQANRDKIIEIAARNDVKPVPAAVSLDNWQPPPVTEKVIEVASHFADAQVDKIAYDIRPLVKEDLARLKRLQGQSIYSILSDIDSLPATARERFRQWTAGVLSTDPSDRGTYEFRQTSDDSIDFIVTTSFEAGGTTMKRPTHVATVTFAEGKALTEYARKINSVQ